MPVERDVPPMTCDCAGCAALKAEVGRDPVLHAFYRKKLLIRGWAGIRTPAEAEYQRHHAPWVISAVARGFPGREIQPQKPSPGGSEAPEVVTDARGPVR